MPQNGLDVARRAPVLRLARVLGLEMHVFLSLGLRENSQAANGVRVVEALG